MVEYFVALTNRKVMNSLRKQASMILQIRDNRFYVMNLHKAYGYIFYPRGKLGRQVIFLSNLKKKRHRI